MSLGEQIPGFSCGSIRLARSFIIVLTAEPALEKAQGQPVGRIRIEGSCILHIPLLAPTVLGILAAGNR